MHCLTLQMNKIKEVVNLVHVMHERHPALQYNVLVYWWSILCSVQAIASEIVILFKMKMMQNCAWLKKMKIRRFNSFTSLLLLSPEVCSTEKVRAEIIYICNTNFGERALCWTCPCWSKQNTVNHLFSHARNFYESRNCFVMNVFGANQSSNVCGIPYYFLENLVLIAKWASLFPVNDKINLMRIQMV